MKLPFRSHLSFLSFKGSVEKNKSELIIAEMRKRAWVTKNKRAQKILAIGIRKTQFVPQDT